MSRPRCVPRHSRAVKRTAWRRLPHDREPPAQGFSPRCDRDVRQSGDARRGGQARSSIAGDDRGDCQWSRLGYVARARLDGGRRGRENSWPPRSRCDRNSPRRQHRAAQTHRPVVANLRRHRAKIPNGAADSSRWRSATRASTNGECARNRKSNRHHAVPRAKGSRVGLPPRGRRAAAVGRRRFRAAASRSDGLRAPGSRQRFAGAPRSRRRCRDLLSRRRCCRVDSNYLRLVGTRTTIASRSECELHGRRDSRGTLTPTKPSRFIAQLPKWRPG